jgi:DNA-binding response OmpR family regulator
MSEKTSPRPRVLVVEDELLIAECLLGNLQDYGVDVLGPLGTVRDVLKLLAENDSPIDLTLLDVNLRGEPAFPVAEALRARRIPFVFMTGYSESAMPPRYRDVPRLEKPVATEDILRVLGLTAAR